jgi:hypothetical protein
MGSRKEKTSRNSTSGFSQGQSTTPSRLSDDMAASSIDIEKHAEPAKTAPPVTLDWDGPDDPDNPRNWGPFKKFYAILVPGSIAFAV